MARRLEATFGGFYVEMMGLIGMGNNPMVSATVAATVAVSNQYYILLCDISFSVYTI